MPYALQPYGLWSVYNISAVTIAFLFFSWGWYQKTNHPKSWHLKFKGMVFKREAFVKNAAPRVTFFKVFFKNKVGSRPANPYANHQRDPSWWWMGVKIRCPKIWWVSRRSFFRRFLGWFGWGCPLILRYTFHFQQRSPCFPGAFDDPAWSHRHTWSLGNGRRFEDLEGAKGEDLTPRNRWEKMPRFFFWFGKI